MGQRHQLFVIAKINGRYRSLCAIHHQWLYGLTAIKRCLDLLKIFGAPDNRLPIEQELLAASKHNDAFWDLEDDQIHFPFISTCLVLGASFNAKKGYYHGITIFDITEPSRVRYCFVDFHGIESELEVQLMTPLPGHVYLHAYYPDPEHQVGKDSQGPLNELKNCELVDVEALRDTWPRGKWEGRDEAQEAVSTTETKSELPLQIPTLEDQAADRLIDCLMGEPENFEPSILLQAEHVRSFLPRLRHRLYEQASTLSSSETTSRLLIKALEGETLVDLSPFTNLPTTAISTIVRELQNRGQIMSINLSNTSLNGEDLMRILSPCPTLKALYLLETPSLPLAALVTTIKELQVRIHDVYHIDLFKKPLVFLSSE